MWSIMLTFFQKYLLSLCYFTLNCLRYLEEYLEGPRVQVKGLWHWCNFSDCFQKSSIFNVQPVVRYAVMCQSAAGLKVYTTNQVCVQYGSLFLPMVPADVQMVIIHIHTYKRNASCAHVHTCTP